MLRTKRPKSQDKTEMLIKKLAILLRIPMLNVDTGVVSLEGGKCGKDQETTLILKKCQRSPPRICRRGKRSTTDHIAISDCVRSS